MCLMCGFVILEGYGRDLVFLGVGLVHLVGLVCGLVVCGLGVLLVGVWAKDVF